MLNPSQIDIASLPSVALTERSELPSSSAVYFLLDEHKSIQYIGATTNLKRRISYHSVPKQCNSIESVAYLNTPVDELNKLEIGLINIHQPKFNKMRQTSCFSGRDNSRKVSVPERFGWHMRMIRVEQEMYSYQLGFKCRMPAHLVSAFERGRISEISEQKLVKMGEVLGVDTLELLHNWRGDRND